MTAKGTAKARVNRSGPSGVEEATEVALDAVPAGAEEVAAGPSGGGAVQGDAATVEASPPGEEGGSEQSGQQEPIDESAGEAELEPDSLPENVQALLEPIAAEAPCGEDPRYSDRFVAIKQEIDKLSENDFDLIAKTAEELLRDDAKDLRVAGYYVFARLYTNGLDGLIESAQLYSAMVERFAEEIHPRKASARNAALGWLNNQKLKFFLEELAEQMDLVAVERLEGCLETLSGHSERLLGEPQSAWAALGSVLEGVKPALLKAEEDRRAAERQRREQAAAGADQRTGNGASSPAGSHSGASIDSDQSLSSALHGAVSYLLEQGAFRRAVTLARAARWSGLTLPPAEAGRTRVPAPRVAAMAEVQKLIEENDLSGALRAVERLFFEPGAHLWLDVQHKGAEIARRLEQSDVAEAIEWEVAGLLRRLPGLASLSFEDGTAFASPATRSWLDTLAAMGGAGGAEPVGEDEAALEEAVVQARGTAAEQGLGPALSALQDFPASSAVQHVRLRLAMAQLCLAHGQAWIAAHTLDRLSQEAADTCLATWFPELAFSIEKTRMALLSERAAAAKGEDKQRLEQAFEDSRMRLCEIDVAKAARLQ